MPENNNPAKNRKIRATGAQLIEAGKTFEEASKVVEEIVDERGLYYVHPANEPHLINGVGTEFIEIIEKLPDLDAVIVPIGAGSEASAAAFLSWKSGDIKSAKNSTFAGGFATGTGYEIPFEIYKDNLEDFVLLSEAEIYEGIALASYYTQNFVEGAGASTIMVALKLKDKLQGKKAVLQFSGSNASPEEIEKAYSLPCFREGKIG